MSIRLTGNIELTTGDMHGASEMGIVDHMHFAKGFDMPDRLDIMLF